MEIKGLSVKTIPEYILKNFPNRYNDWYETLPDASKTIFRNLIKTNEWYPVTSALTIPIRHVGKVYFNGDWQKAVWEMGRFSAGSL